MCLAIPYTIREIFSDGSARALSKGVETSVRLDLIEAPALGDTVLVHAGFAIQKLDKDASEELLALWAEVEKAEKSAEASFFHDGTL
ncbi:MAG: HypC/HybG/HupF family hydrogenase formation chaperone [Synergistaceae bacterium]|jgi:hydrogenase expression/formation protein HypC|nr:HypC/HybG/HupF family hydrogenase formation chaperone [Synergistaceae bacterium]